LSPTQIDQNIEKTKKRPLDAVPLSQAKKVIKKNPLNFSKSTNITIIRIDWQMSLKSPPVTWDSPVLNTFF